MDLIYTLYSDKQTVFRLKDVALLWTETITLLNFCKQFSILK